MGYSKITKINQFLPPGLFAKAGGTWTIGVSSNVIAETRSTADSSFALYLPIILPSSEAYRQGSLLKSIDVMYKIAGAAADDFSDPVLHKMTMANGVAASGAAVACSFDTGHDTAAERLAVATHKMTITLDTPEWIDDNYMFWLQLAIDAAASTSFSLYGAILNFEQNL